MGAEIEDFIRSLQSSAEYLDNAYVNYKEGSMSLYSMMYALHHISEESLHIKDMIVAKAISELKEGQNS